MASLILRKKIWLGIFLAVIGFIIAFNAFYNLHAGMLKDWDEARHGVSAIEMMESGNYLVNTWGRQDGLLELKTTFKLLGNIVRVQNLWH